MDGETWPAENFEVSLFVPTPPVYALRHGQDPSHQKSSTFNEGARKGLRPPKLGVPNLRLLYILQPHRQMRRLEVPQEVFLVPLCVYLGLRIL
jgi:hypothetical protein